MLAINTYGHIDAIFYVLNGMAMIMNSPFMASTLKLFIVLSFMMFVLKGASIGNFKAGIKTLVVSVIVINFMLVPKASIMIYDHVTKQRDKVDNLPLGFVLPVGVLENLGAALTEKVDQAFSVPNKSLSYMEYGPIFGASLIQQSRNWRIQDPIFAEMMESFLERCVLMTAAIGRDFTEHDVITSSNVWDDVIKPNMKDGIREVVLRGSGHKQMGCKTAMNLLEQKFNEAYQDNYGILSKTRFALAGRDSYTDRGSFPSNMDAFFKKNLDTVFGGYLDQKTNALSTMRQIMLMNSFARYGDYGTLRAIQVQENNWATTGKLAGYYVPMLLTILKCLTYAGFMFICPAIILLGSFAPFKNFITLVGSFQMWPVLSSILNMFTDLFSSATFPEVVRHGGISLATINGAVEASDMIVAVASSLQMAVPVVSYMLISGGMSGMVHFYQNATAGTSMAASRSTEELISGNRNFDNESLYNTNNYKTDRTASYKSDNLLMERADGSLYKQSADGKDITISGEGVNKSQGDFKVFATSNAQQIMDESIRDQESNVKSTQESLFSSRQKVADQGYEIIKNIDDRINRGDSTALNKALAEHKEINDMVQKARQMEKTDSSTMESGTSVHAGVSASKGLKVLGSGASIEAGAKVEASYKGSATDSASTSERGENSVNISARQIQDFLKDENVRKELGFSDSYIDKFNENVSQSTGLESRVSNENQKLQSMETAQQNMRSSGVDSPINITEESIDATAKKYDMYKEYVRDRTMNGDRSMQMKVRAEGEKIAKEYQRQGVSSEFKMPNSEDYRRESRAINEGLEHAKSFRQLHEKASKQISRDSLKGDSISIKEEVDNKIKSVQGSISEKDKSLNIGYNEQAGQVSNKIVKGTEDKTNFEQKFKDKQGEFKTSRWAKPFMDHPVDKTIDVISNAFSSNESKPTESAKQIKNDSNKNKD
jgi:conjugal transfer mating pair stabilization protein TraG